ncbi:hypothetical protein FS749_010380 [Ceratobasidium sp. UAMH 11750]|nr:hypothetical protein FS749_010380 [Ceratobasidium sp. UAMH 11750]
MLTIPASPIPLSDSRRKIQAMGEGILGGAALSVLAYEAFPPNTEGYQYVRDDHYIDDGEYVEDDQYVDNNQYFSDDPFSDNASDGDEVSEDNYTHFWDNAYPDGNLGLHFDNDLAASDDEPYDIPAFSTYLPGEVDSPGEPYTDDDAYVGGCQEAYPVEIGYDQYVDNGSETNEGQAGEHDWTGDWDGDQALYNNESDSGNMIGNYTSYIADSDDDHVYGQSAYKDQGSREGQDVYADQSSYDDSSSHEDPGAYEAPEYRAQELNWDQEYEYVSPYADTNEVYDDDVYDDDLDDGYQSYDVDDDVYDVYGDDF